MHPHALFFNPPNFSSRLSCRSSQAVYFYYFCSSVWRHPGKRWFSRLKVSAFYYQGYPARRPPPPSPRPAETYHNLSASHLLFCVNCLSAPFGGWQGCLGLAVGRRGGRRVWVLAWGRVWRDLEARRCLNKIHCWGSLLVIDFIEEGYERTSNYLPSFISDSQFTHNSPSAKTHYSISALQTPTIPASAQSTRAAPKRPGHPWVLLSLPNYWRHLGPALSRSSPWCILYSIY